MIKENEKSISSGEVRQRLLNRVNNILFRRGMTRREYNSMKHFLVAPGYTVEEFIGVGLDSGQIKWKEDELVLNVSRIKLDLDQETEDALRKKINETGERPERIVMKVLLKELGLSN